MHLNIADRLRQSAELYPHQEAVVFPWNTDFFGRFAYTHLTFQQLHVETDQLARGLMELGIRPGHKLVLMVRPSLEFIALTFAIFKSGATVVLIDPGMGRTNIFRCLQEVVPDGFVAISPVHWIRRLTFWRFPHARFNVDVYGGAGLLPSYKKLLQLGAKSQAILPLTKATDPAAIIFTSGSTGPPKGVCYEHGMFNAQVDMLRDFYQIKPGEIDLPGFPLFALFNSAMGVTTVIPAMDPTKPALVNPTVIQMEIEDYGMTQAFGSPAFWNRVAREAEQKEWTFPSLRRALSAGGPVPNHVLKRVRKMLTQPDADIHTPYGATEALPVASISGREVLEQTAQLTELGNGTCVGTPFPNVLIRIIAMSDQPIATIDQAQELPPGEIGEIIVSSPSVTREYYKREQATLRAKIQDPAHHRFWHRMGDVGYLDADSKLWFCGRMAHVVHTAQGRMFSVCCEAIYEQHPQIYRAALVGVGPKNQQQPIMIVEPESGQFPTTSAAQKRMTQELLQLGQANKLTRSITTIMYHKSFPVDKRHNVKVNREELAGWAAKQPRPNPGQ
jgi:acyl-CoA synthetase (AMP-forming)/AMP-acid ligase II